MLRRATCLIFVLTSLGVAARADEPAPPPPPATRQIQKADPGLVEIKIPDGQVAGEATPPADKAAPPAEKPAEPVAPPQAQSADEQFELKIKSLEENVNDLKEKVVRTKSRLLLLQEAVFGQDITAGAKAVLVHRNEMGSSFVLESVAYALDGAPIFTKTDHDGDLDKKQEIEIFNARIVPGNHQITVKLQYRGHGYGIFSYLEGYKFRVQSSYTFNAEGGKVTLVKVVGYEKGNITTDLKDRPAVKYDVEVTKDTARREPQADAK